jgi:hypothetical protein
MHIFKPLSILLLLGIACHMALAITESERPKLDGYEMDEATQATVDA